MDGGRINNASRLLDSIPLLEGAWSCLRAMAASKDTSQGVSGFARIAVAAVRQRAQLLTRMLCHILPQLLDGQLRTMDVARLGEASRKRIGLR